MKGYFDLKGSDPNWFASGPTAIGASERCFLLSEARRTALDLKESAAGTTRVIDLDGTVMLVGWRDEGNVLVRVIDSSRDLDATFSFKLDYDPGSEQVSISELTWEQDATPVFDLDLTARAYCGLKRGGIRTIGQLASKVESRVARHSSLPGEATGRSGCEAR